VGELMGIARFKFHEGKVGEFKRLSAKAMEIVKAQDTGTLQYDTYLNVDETEAIVIERYRDSAAAIEHGKHMAEITEEVLKTASVYGELLGEVSDEIRANLATGPVQLFTPFASMDDDGPR
jgi:quinol monooxygenase YgiN